MGLRALAARAYARLLRNVLPNGAVVGSPAQGKEPGQPNYWFYWQRDGSVTMGHLIDWYRRPPLGLDTGILGEAIEHYSAFVARTQSHGQVGTSRYTVDGNPITGFGNPQLDGPPLSTMTLARMEQSAQTWELLRGYLNFLLTPEGRGPCMDAWEFIYGWHFNAAFLRRRALLVGAAVATRLAHADDATRYASEAQRVGERLTDFLDLRLGRLRAFSETYNPWFTQMNGLDMAMICALLSGRDMHPQSTTGGRGEQRKAHLGQDLDSLTHPGVLATMNALEDVYVSLFKVNRDWTAAGNAGCGLGRFPEDANDGVGTSGGNPWPLATLWGAQFHYHVAQEVRQVLENASGHPIALDDARQVAFFQRAAGQGIDLTQPIELSMWQEQLLPAVVARGDGYLNFVVHHLPEDGSVTEQIDRDTGQPRGARDLSWALSELITTIALREQVHLST
jgi:glucoamylase